MKEQCIIPETTHRSAWKTPLAIATLAVGGTVLLWLLTDHRRGLRWAQSVVGNLFPDVGQISPQELEDWMNAAHREPPVVWDVRGKEEYDVSHLRHAVHVPVQMADADLRWQVERLGERALVCYCSAGYRGAKMARRLRALGLKRVYNLAGGVFRWANEGGELVREGEPTAAVHPYHAMFRRMLTPERRTQGG